MSITRIQKWGNSFGLRIPKAILDEMKLGPDARLDVHQEQGRIVITPIQDPKVTLDELLNQITPENQHKELEWGMPKGEEQW